VVCQKHDRKLFFDIDRLRLFLRENKIEVSPIEIEEEVIQQFIYAVCEVNPRSQARIISGLKSFFGYLILKILDSTTLELIESPKTGRKLPDTLSIDEIDTLIKAIDLTSNEGERNRAMLETLYGCGLRVGIGLFENI
jgi:integrase/recombinase XerD